MTNAKTTKRALLVSFMALLLCFTMLLGTTYAWFTDSVASANNIIKTGNLDVVLEIGTLKDTADPANSADPANWDWTEVDSATKIFKDYELYEPGYVETVALRVRNNGSLSFKYNLATVIAAEKEGLTKNGDPIKLSEYLKVVSAPSLAYTSQSRSILMGLAKDTISASGIGAAVCSLNELVSEDVVLNPGQSTLITLAIVMPDDVGNEANHDGNNRPEITLGVTVVATQYTEEEDSFGKDYDKDASLDDVKIEKTISLTEDVTERIEVSDDEAVTIDMNGYSLLNTLVNNGEAEVNNGKISTPNNATGVAAVGFANYGDATLNNVTMTAGSASDYGNILYAGSTTEYNDVEITSKGGGVGITDGAKATFNSGSVYVDSASTSGRYLFYVVGDGSELTINDGAFSWDPADNQKRAYIYVGSGATVYVNGGTFGPASTRSGYTAGILGTGNVVITGGTFGFNPTTWVADGYEAVESNGIWTVSAK